MHDGCCKSLRMYCIDRPGVPPAGASQRKSCVASSSGKIWKDPYRVEYINGNYTLSTHFPYTFVSPIHTKKWTFTRKHPLHTFYEVDRFNPPFCVYTLLHNFAFSNPPFHTQIWTSWLLHFFLKPPPGMHPQRLMSFACFCPHMKKKHHLSLAFLVKTHPRCWHTRSSSIEASIGPLTSTCRSTYLSSFLKYT